MATTEHSLRIKAVLDSSEIQQEILKLKAQSGQTLTGNGQNNGGLGNLTSLNSTISRLNSTLTLLQQAINRLNQNPVRASSSSSSRGSTSFIPVGAIFNNRKLQLPSRNLYSSRSILSDVAEFEDENRYWRQQLFDPGYIRSVRKFIRDPRVNNLANLKAGYDDYTTVENMLDKYGLYNGASLKDVSKNFANANRAYAGLRFARPLVRGSLDEYYGFGGRYGRISPLTERQSFFQANRRALRWGGGIAAHQILGSVDDYFKQTENKPGLVAMGIAQSAAIGGMLGGLPGLAIGAGVGALSEAFKELTERTKALADVMAELQSRVKAALQVDKELTKKAEKEIDDRRFKVGDVGYFQDRIKFKQGILDKLNAEQAEIGTEPGALTAYEKETQRQIEVFKAASPTGTLPESIKRRLRLADRYKTNIGTIDILNELIAGYKDNLTALGVKSLKLEDDELFLKNAKTRDKWHLLSSRDFLYGDLNDANLKKNRLLKGDRRTNLKALEEVTDQINAFNEKIAIINDELKTRAERTKLTRMNHLSEEINGLEERLQSMISPNMSNVNSLAGYGYMINKKDDEARLKMQTDYASELTKLQREIRDKIQELKDPSTFY